MIRFCKTSRRATDVMKIEHGIQRNRDRERRKENERRLRGDDNDEYYEEKKTTKQNTETKYGQEKIKH